MRVSGKVSASKAARMLEVDRRTIVGYCRKALRGEPSKFKQVEQHPLTGYYWIDLGEVKALQRSRR